jgi:hypothetical protein
MTKSKINVYVVDTGSFILLGQLPQDILPFIWNQIVELIKENRLVTHFEVKREIQRFWMDDPIKIWLLEMEKKYQFILPPTPFQAIKTAEIQDKYPHFVDTDTDKPYADPCLIVQMLDLQQNLQKTFSDAEKEYFLVTEERESSERKNLNNVVEVTKIPDFCKIYEIKYLNFWEMVRKEGWRWTK